MINETANKMDRQTSLSGMVTFVCLICVYTIKEYKTAFHARRINVKDEIFISEWDKENARVHFSDKDLSHFELTRVIPKTIHCLSFEFRAVLDPD